MIRKINGEEYDFIDGLCYTLDHKGRIAANEDWDCKNDVFARFYIDEYFSDERMIDWYYAKQFFTIEEYEEFLNSVKRDFYHPKAEELVRFLIEYDNGAMCPNRWDLAEPVKRIFNPNDEQILHEIISELSFPMGAVDFKRVKTTFKYQMCISNGDHRAYFEELGKGKKKIWTLSSDFTKKRQRGESYVSLITKISELRKMRKDPIEFCDKFAQALKKVVNVYKYHMHIGIDPSFYRKPTKEVIYYDIPETHCDWREE